MSARDSLHEESWLLLPWLANGRLEGVQRLRTELHLRDCRECAQELEQQRLICGSLTSPERVTYAPGPSFRKLMQRIDGAPAPRAGETPGVAGRGPSGLAAAWRPPGLAWAATFVLAVGLAALLPLAYRWSQPLYATHTDAAPVARGVLHVAFDRSLTIGEVQELLQSAGARVVEGPDRTGIFGVAPVGAAGDSAELPGRLRTIAERLRADARVRWVEPQTDSAPPARGQPPPRGS